uniref:Transposase n=1 Tax=Ignavibacterium album TaxID=591197 RepID=A0A832DK82_9BACT
MSKFQNKYRIESTRIPGYDYSNPNWYYVTINTKNHYCYFGNILDGKMFLNDIGKLTEKFWQEIPVHFKTAEIDYYIIMPNHIHGIIIINELPPLVETGHAPSLQEQTKRYSLSNIIGSFKSAVSNKIHKIGYNQFQWQPRFYERIIRNEKELFRIRKYIEQNPLKWDIEKNNPENLEL